MARNDLSPSFMQEIFFENESHYDLGNNNEFVQPIVRLVGNGTESVRFKGPQLWQILPQTIRNSESLAQFKANIKHWREKIVHASCVTFLFRIWALYNVFTDLFLLYTLMNCKLFKFHCTFLSMFVTYIFSVGLN